jgi:hypothetical protein
MRIDTQHNPLITQPLQFINWKQFRSNLENIPYENNEINNPEELELLIANTTNEINYSLLNSTITKNKTNSKTRDPQLTNLINNKNRARKNWQRHRTPLNKTIMNNAQELVKKYVRDKNNKSWNNYIISLSTHDNSIWRAAKRFKNQFSIIPPLKDNDNNTHAYTDDQKANLIANCLKNQFTLNPTPQNNIDNIVQTSLNLFHSTEIQPYNPLVVPSMVQHIIKKIPKRKSPGIDGITPTILKHLPMKYIFKITKIINHIFILTHFPSNWKNSLIIPILKPNKNKFDPISYRPISLLNTISKIVEKFIAIEINKHLEDNNILIPYQFGFRKNLSAPHQIYRLTEHLSAAKIKKYSTAAIFLDIQKAFDKVWIPGLIHKLINYNFPPYLIKIIESYLSNRTFQVKINKTLSIKQKMNAGLPQGAILSPVLYNIFINDIPTFPNSNIAIFADDTALYTTYRNYKYAINNLNKHIKLIAEWLSKWKIKLNADKSVAVMFTNKMLKTYKDHNIKIGDTNIPWATTVKYLGVTLDKNLTWNTHITQIRDKFRGAKRALYPLIARNSKLSFSNKLLIYKSFLRPVLTYGSVAWSYAANNLIHKLSASQNIVVREITNSPWYLRNGDIHREIHLPTLKNYLVQLATNFHNNLNNDLFDDLCNYDQTAEANRKRPKAILNV